MNIALTTQETLGLMKESLAKNVTVSDRPDRLRPAGAGEEPLPDDHAAQKFAASRRAAQPRRRGALALDLRHDRLGLRRDGLGSGRPAFGKHVLFGTSITLPYVTLGEEDTVTFEAEAAAQGFEDINATATLRILQKTMRKEETALLGGNTSLALGKPGTPTLSASGTGGTLPAGDLFGDRRRA